MADITSLLKEADQLGILNIDVSNNKLTPEVIEAAIEATRYLNSNLDNNVIAKKLQEAGQIDPSHEK
ncbi:MAG: hypothetical protein LBI06_02855 [Treponema sp.]|jgi:hypothetical protein|nr:hypothetical protein [Treponema sp.]